MRALCHRLLSAAALVSLCVAAGAAAAAPKPADPPPNVVFLYADDLGYGDLACYGSPVAQTPRLDALAAEGIRFTQFYVSHCVCSPTRCSAITGHYPSRHRIYGHLAHLASNKARRMPDWLDVAAPSLPRALQQAGYRTAMIGKWHLGGGSGRMWMADEIVINSPAAPAVAEYGFDHVRTIFGNSPTWKGAELRPEPHDIYPYADEEFSTWSSRSIADETIGFLRTHASGPQRAQPFYVNVWFHDVHTPMRPTDEMREGFRELPEKSQVHYSMLRFMDRQIGRVLDTLDELGLRENTLVLFTSDNGAVLNRGGSNGPLRDWKHGLYEGGIREPLIVRWPAQTPAGRVDEYSVLNIVDLVPTIAQLAGAQMPDGYRSDGEVIVDALRGGTHRTSRSLYWHHPNAGQRSPQLAIRRDDWKLLADPNGARLQLYNLAEDVGEAHDRAGDQPQLAAELLQAVQQWHAEMRRAAADVSPGGAAK
jgi:N-acetylgalactosamine-6-sulfatase